MLRNLRSRRRSPYGAYLCAVFSALLLLLSVSLLYSRLSLSNPPSPHLHRTPSLFSDSSDDLSATSSDDPIDELDIIDEQDHDADAAAASLDDPLKSAGYFYDPLSGSVRRSFKSPPRSIHNWDDPQSNRQLRFAVGSAAEDDRAKAAFGSDDLPVENELRRMAAQVTAIEDALMLRSTSPLRDGWGDWFDKKAVFLRKDRMFKSNFDVLNPLNNPMIQDPDGPGVSGFTKGDRIVQKLWMNEFKRVPFPGKKVLLTIDKNGNVDDTSDGVSSVTKGAAERRTLKLNDKDESIKEHAVNGAADGGGKLNGRISVSEKRQGKTVEFVDHIYADGKSWGYYPGLPLHLSFTEFVEAFFRVGKCGLRVFMVWNSPPWMFTVRHQRGLESLLFHHPDACVVVLSETVELDFFKDSFVKDGYKVAVAMPNLDELLKGMPAHIFSSVWFEWRKTNFYATHYSELIRLAALYKYGGIYLDSDIIVLKPISFLNNTVGMEEDHGAGSALNGAVMAFERRSSFIRECLEEFYMTYDDTSLRGNGADLLTRVARKVLGDDNKSLRQLELKVEPSHIFFPISSQNISRFFVAPETEIEKAQQDALLEKVLHESLTFHFWNSLTSALIPESDSLVSRLMNYACIRCSELL